MTPRARILALIGRELAVMECASVIPDADRLLTLAKIAAVAEGLSAGDLEDPAADSDALEAALRGG